MLLMFSVEHGDGASAATAVQSIRVREIMAMMQIALELFWMGSSSETVMKIKIRFKRQI